MVVLTGRTTAVHGEEVRHPVFRLKGDFVGQEASGARNIFQGNLHIAFRDSHLKSVGKSPGRYEVERTGVSSIHSMNITEDSLLSFGIAR